MARDLEEVADVLYVILKDNRKYFGVDHAYFSRTTLNFIADRNNLNQKQIGFLRHILKKLNCVLVVEESKAILMTDKVYRKVLKHGEM